MSQTMQKNPAITKKVCFYRLNMDYLWKRKTSRELEFCKQVFGKKCSQAHLVLTAYDNLQHSHSFQLYILIKNETSAATLVLEEIDV